MTKARKDESQETAMLPHRKTALRNLRWAFSLCALLALASIAFSAEAPADVPTLAVLNFTNRNPGDGWDWLEKGLADMLITDLAASRKLQLVERERMQASFAELGLARGGLVTTETAQRAGRILRAQYALFGSYFRDNDGRIEIESHVVNILTQELRRVEWVRGAADRVLELEKTLALNIVGRFDFPLEPDEKASLLAMRTQSLDATRLFYQALDAYDV